MHHVRLKVLQSSLRYFIRSQKVFPVFDATMTRMDDSLNITNIHRFRKMRRVTNVIDDEKK